MNRLAAKTQAGLGAIEALLTMGIMLAGAGVLMLSLVAGSTNSRFLEVDSSAYDQATILYERMAGMPFGSASAPAPAASQLANLVSIENTVSPPGPPGGAPGGPPPQQHYQASTLTLRQVGMASPLVWRYMTHPGQGPGGQGPPGLGGGGPPGLGGGAPPGWSHGQKAWEANNPLAGEWEISVSPDLNGTGSPTDPVNLLSQAQGDLLRIEVRRNGRLLISGIRSRDPKE